LIIYTYCTYHYRFCNTIKEETFGKGIVIAWLYD